MLQPGWLIDRLPPYSHISDCMINDLHWRPVLACVRYKVLLLVAKSQQGLAPKYLCELLADRGLCLNLYLPAPLICCALLIVVIFLYHGPVLLYPRIGPLLWWVLHSGMTDTTPALWNVMLLGISSASLRDLKTYFHQPVTLRVPLNSLLWEALYR